MCSIALSHIALSHIALSYGELSNGVNRVPLLNEDASSADGTARDVTRLLERFTAGDAVAAAELLPTLYDELRKLAAGKLSRENPGQTLQATALVHEAYCRLIKPGQGEWKSRAHFFGAAAEAMRRILVEQARRKRRRQAALAGEPPEIVAERVLDQDRLLDVDQALTQLATKDPEAAEVVKLHIFGGLSLEEAAEALEISRASVYRNWAYARAQLKVALRDLGTG